MTEELDNSQSNDESVIDPETNEAGRKAGAIVDGIMSASFSELSPDAHKSVRTDFSVFTMGAILKHGDRPNNIYPKQYSKELWNELKVSEGGISLKQHIIDACVSDGMEKIPAAVKTGKAGERILDMLRKRTLSVDELLLIRRRFARRGDPQEGTQRSTNEYGPTNQKRTFTSRPKNRRPD